MRQDLIAVSRSHAESFVSAGSSIEWMEEKGFLQLHGAMKVNNTRM